MQKMKNLYIYINPAQEFSNSDWGKETETLVKIQIDNSIDIGWRIEDIVLVTNFPYEYRGVKAIEVPGDLYCEHSSGTPSKINVIVYMFEHGMIEDAVYFFHDFDAFELVKITQGEIGIVPGQIALTDYGYVRGRDFILSRWSTGCLFFDKDSRDVFEMIKTAVYKYQANEEVSLLALTRHNKHGICDRIKKLNISYNLATRRRNISLCLRDAVKPLRVLHFHPYDVRITSYGHTNVEVCLRGKNETGIPLVPDRLLKIFNNYGIV
jgi:hypothetical protein